MNLFSYDSMLSRFLHLTADILTLHVLWLVFSLPIVTIGASTTALYYACMKRVRTGEGYVFRNFMHSFKENLRQSTLIWLILVGIGLLFTVDLRIGMALDGALGTFMLISCSIFLIPYLLLCIYIFPVQAKFENRIRDNIKNALIMALRHFPCSLLLAAIYVTFVLLLLSFVPFIGLMCCCGAGLLGYLTSNIFIYIFRKYIPDELERDLEASGERFM